ncbi:FixH family protein [Vannielia sp.]|uniref:FixH family protein n=1 Tax=Vannielia sp. TaxID=2813045 RepID=UPI00260E5C01|nr:FixH family protein [Vannielia sp.]MDF1873355.1 FixH family protein [Vannielia sp.]
MGEITGRQVFIFTAGAFAVIIGVNLVMAYKAVSTFPGLEVKNSYIASQEFNERKAEQVALGWVAEPRYENGVLTVAVTEAETGKLAKVEEFTAMVGRTTERQHDREPEFALGAEGFSSPMELGPGRWEIRVQAKAADGTDFIQRLILTVRG